MPVFVHLTSERHVASIKRDGIKPRRKSGRPYGVYALPVTRNFYISHQWVRELRRGGGGTMVGVYFRLSDDEVVEAGHYNRGRERMTAARAVALLMSQEAQREPRTTKRRRGPKESRPDFLPPYAAEGFEVVVPRRIRRSEIIRVRALPQVVGWRYRPRANGHPPIMCMCCDRGEYGIRKMLAIVEEHEAADKPSKIVMFGRKDSSYDRVRRLRRNPARKRP